MMKNNSSIKIGSSCAFEDRNWTVKKFSSLQKVLLEDHNGKLKSANIDQIEIIADQKLEKRSKIIDQINDAEWEEAQRRYSVLSSLELYLKENDTPINDAIKIIASNNGISARTLYRWKKKYDSTNLVSSLAPDKSSGGRGKGRVDQEIEQLILKVINEFHFKSQNPRVSKSYRELTKKCKKADLDPPALNTFRSRVQLLSRKENVQKQFGKSIANHLFDPVPGSYPEVDAPMDVVQIDHTRLDLIVVDEMRRPIGRPWITLAIDIYSRMVTGYFISFDSPGLLGTGISITQSMLPKEDIIQKYNLKSEWPIHGRIMNIHTDNAPEFKSKALIKACLEYGTNLNFRPKGKTHWGGHIERLLGNFLQEIHLIPGTTFSNIQKRRDYKSEDLATITLEELDKWICTFIVDVYHNKPHSGINMSPLYKYYDGIYNSTDSLVSGMGTFEYDPLKLKLDFLPAEERTIQRTGVQIDHIRYYADVLMPFINNTNPSSNLYYTNSGKAPKFTFKRDPRKLSCIYFLDPIQNQYFPIYYANKSRREMSIWEHRIILKELKKNRKIDKITEDIIFDAFERMDQIISKAQKNKKKAMKESRSKQSSNYLQPSKPNGSDLDKDFEELDFDNIEAFSYTTKL